MRLIGNILWILFGGLILAVLWAIAGLICCITIVGIPLGIQCFKFAHFMLVPFSRTISYEGNVGHFLVNVLWIVVFGWELALTSIAIGAVWCVTIVGIPFGIQSFKFAQLAIMPFGAKLHENR